MKYETTFEGKPIEILDCSVETGRRTRAGVEGADYEFGKIPNSDYVTCVYKDAVYVVLKTDKTVQCTCEYFRKNPGMICEHLLALREIKEEDYEAAPADIVTLLGETEGWTVNDAGKFVPPSKHVTPEVVAELPPESEEVPAIEQPTEKPAQKTGAKKPLCVATCQYCEMVIKASTQEKADERCANHEKLCKKRPANAPEVPKTETPAPPEKKTPVQVTHDAPPEEEKPTTKVKPTTDTKPVKKAHPTPNAVSTDVREMPSDAVFQQAKVARILKNQGSIYKVSGKETPDSAAVSSYAIASGVSTETTVIEQTKEYARATVRAYKGGRYTEGSVLIRKDAIFEKLVIDLAEKNPAWIIGWSDGLPEFDLNSTVHIGDARKILGLHIAGVVADKWMFASRDCETKAGRRAMIKMLGADWREDDEIESEVDEMKTVAKRR